MKSTVYRKRDGRTWVHAMEKYTAYSSLPLDSWRSFSRHNDKGPPDLSYCTWNWDDSSSTERALQKGAPNRSMP